MRGSARKTCSGVSEGSSECAARSRAACRSSAEWETGGALGARCHSAVSTSSDTAAPAALRDFSTRDSTDCSAAAAPAPAPVVTPPCEYSYMLNIQFIYTIIQLRRSRKLQVQMEKIYLWTIYLTRKAYIRPVTVFQIKQVLLYFVLYI